MMLFDDWISLTSDPALAKQGKKGLSTALKDMCKEIREKQVEFRGELKYCTMLIQLLSNPHNPKTGRG